MSDFGRPKKWNSEEELFNLMEDYFDNTDFYKYSVTGLCLHLDCDKQTLLNYQKNNAFKHLISRAKMRIENSYELSLRKNGRTGDIFALKNFGWKDVQHVNDDTDRLPIQITVVPAVLDESS